MPHGAVYPIRTHHPWIWKRVHCTHYTTEVFKYVNACESTTNVMFRFCQCLLRIGYEGSILLPIYARGKKIPPSIKLSSFNYPLDKISQLQGNCTVTFNMFAPRKKWCAKNKTRVTRSWRTRISCSQAIQWLLPALWIVWSVNLVQAQTCWENS